MRLCDGVMRMNKELENYINNIPKDDCEAYGHWCIWTYDYELQEDVEECVKCGLNMQNPEAWEDD